MSSSRILLTLAGALAVLALFVGAAAGGVLAALALGLAFAGAMRILRDAPPDHRSTWANLLHH